MKKPKLLSGSHARIAALLVLLTIPVGCGDDEFDPGTPEPYNPYVDGGVRDASPRDAGPRDAGPRDAGPRDAAPDANAPPVAAAPQVVLTLLEDTSSPVDPRVTDAEGAALVYTTTTPAHGAVTGTAPPFTYTPTANYAGTDAFEITVSDGVNTLAVPVAITVTPVNDPPVADDADLDAVQDTDLAITLTATDIDSNTLTYTLVEQPEHGTLDGTAPTLTYTPDRFYSGPDSFTFTVSDGELTSAEATVTLDVGHVITCGDGVVEDGEACDDGNADDTDACRNNCVVATCGDGVVQAGVEQCDDANQVDTDACRNTCAMAACGDGVVHAGVEPCDDGNQNDTDACRNTCALASCGDGVVGPGEQCEDGNQVDTDACRNNCLAAACGDGVIRAGVEQCDDANASNTDGCLNTCVTANCGDGFVQGGVEQCDDANASNTDACLNNCVMPSCGDGFVQGGVEQCDDANNTNADGCLNNCLVARCGDGFLQAGVEQCDDANANNTDACLNNCAAASCGDGFVQAGFEQCDDANGDNTDNCLNSCVASACGDGFVEAGVEQCDDANQLDTDACRNSCAAAACGDGVVHAGVEQCDDGNQNNIDTCQNDCTPVLCGNGVIDPGEECDDTNHADADGCGHSCRVERCGDGLVQLFRGETCDDGNLANGDGCDASCQAEPFVTTAPLLISDQLSCTTSVANAARKIAVDGSGTLYAAMSCGIDAYVAISSDRGHSFSLPRNLSADLPNAPVVVAQVAVTAAAASGRAYVAIMLNTGEVYLRRTIDNGATWGAASFVGAAVSTSSGLSLDAFNDNVYVGFSTNGGVNVARNGAAGVGSFDITPVGISIAFFDLLYDVTQGTLAVVADTPGFHVRTSSDGGLNFVGEVNPPGQQFYSDWAIGNGRIFAVGINLGAQGDSSRIYVIPSSNPSASTFVAGLPVVTTPQSRTVSANTAGDAFVASTLDGGGVRLDRLPVGAAALSAPRLLSATGSSPVVTSLPGAQGAAVAYTEGGSVFATVQQY